MHGLEDQLRTPVSADIVKCVHLFLFVQNDNHRLAANFDWQQISRLYELMSERGEHPVLAKHSSLLSFMVCLRGVSHIGKRAAIFCFGRKPCTCCLIKKFTGGHCW